MVRLWSFIFLPVYISFGQVIDQGFDNNVFGGNAILSSQPLGQTFRVGVAGQLVEVRLDLFKNTSFGNSTSPVRMLITDVGSGQINYYAEEYIPLSSIPAGVNNSVMVSVPLSSPIPLRAETDWAIRLFSNDNTLGSDPEWTHDDNAYSRGFGFTIGPEQTVNSLGVTDHSFLTVMSPQIVTGDPAPIGTIPEPSAYRGFVGCALLSFAFLRKWCQT